MEEISLQKRNELIKKVHDISDTPEETIIFLMVFLDSMMSNVWSGDVMIMSYYRAMDQCEALGISKDKAEEIWSKLKQLWRNKQPKFAKEMFGDIKD